MKSEPTSPNTEEQLPSKSVPSTNNKARHTVSINVTLFATAFIVFIVVVWVWGHFSNKGTDYDALDDQAASNIHLLRNDSVKSTAVARRDAENVPVSLLNENRAVTDADMDETAFSPQLSYVAVANDTEKAASRIPTDFRAAPMAGLSPTPDPLPSPPMPPATMTPAAQVPNVGGLMPIQTNMSSQVSAARPTPPLLSVVGDLSPKKVAEQLALQSEQLIYAGVKTSPTPRVTPSYGLTPTPAVPVRSIAVPEGLGKWSVTPTPTTAENDLKVLSAMQHIDSKDFIAPTPLPYLVEHDDIALKQSQDMYSQTIGMPPPPTPRPAMNGAAPVPTIAVPSNMFPTAATVDSNNMSLLSPTPEARPTIITNDLSGAAVPSPTPTSLLSGITTPTPIGTVSPLLSSTPAVNAMPTPALTPVPSSLPPTGEDAASLSKTVNDIMPPTAQPTIPPNLAVKPQTTPRSGVVVSHGIVNQSAMPPPDTATPSEGMAPASSDSEAVVTPNILGIGNAQAQEDVLPTMSTTSATVSEADKVEAKIVKNKVKEVAADPSIARAASKAIDKSIGEDAASDRIVPDLSVLPPELAKRLGAAPGHLTAQVGDNNFSSDEVNKQLAAIMKVEGINPNTPQRDNMEVRLVEDWAERMAIAEYGSLHGESVSDEETQAYLSKLDDRSKKVQQEMLANGISQEALDNEARAAALTEKMVNEEYQRRYSTDAALKEVYDTAPDLYNASRSVHLSMIFKRAPNDAEAARAVRSVMQSIKKEITNGADFGLVALRESEDPSRAKSGDLGWLDASSNRIDESVAEAVANLEPGQTSDVILGKDGFYIYKLEGIKDPPAGFEGARGNVESAVRTALRIGFYEKAKAEIKVIIGGELQVPGQVQPRRNAKKATMKR